MHIGTKVYTETTYLIHGYQRPVLPIPGKALHALTPSANDVAIGRFVDPDPRRRGRHLRSGRWMENVARRDWVVFGVGVDPPRQGFGRDVVVVGSVHLGKSELHLLMKEVSSLSW